MPAAEIRPVKLTITLISKKSYINLFKCRRYSKLTNLPARAAATLPAWQFVDVLSTPAVFYTQQIQPRFARIKELEEKGLLQAQGKTESDEVGAFRRGIVAPVGDAAVWGIVDPTAAAKHTTSPRCGSSWIGL